MDLFLQRSQLRQRSPLAARTRQPRQRGAHQATLGHGELQPFRATRLLENRCYQESRKRCKGHRLLVILNSKNEEFKADFDFGNTKIGSFKPYVTDDNNNLKEGSVVKVDGTKCSFSVPARSATTVEFILWQEPKVEPPADSTESIAFEKRFVQNRQGIYKVFSPIGAFIGEFEAGDVGELRNAMTNVGLSRGVYMVKRGNAKTQRVVLR